MASTKKTRALGSKEVVVVDVVLVVPTKLGSYTI